MQRIKNTARTEYEYTASIPRNFYFIDNRMDHLLEALKSFELVHFEEVWNQKVLGPRTADYQAGVDHLLQAMVVDSGMIVVSEQDSHQDLVDFWMMAVAQTPLVYWRDHLDEEVPIEVLADHLSEAQETHCLEDRY